MNQKDLRNMVIEVFEMLTQMLPTTNEAFCLSQATFLSTASQDPKRAVLIESHFQRLLKPTRESVSEVVAAIEGHMAKLKNDSLWLD